MATDSESETFEQVYTSEAFPHGDAEDDTGFNRHTRVGSKPRSEGRLFTRTDQVGAPQCSYASCTTTSYTNLWCSPSDREGDRGGAPETRCHDFHDLITFCRLRMRPIQLHLLSFYRPHRHRISHLVPTTPWWWLAEANLTQGRAFRPPRPMVTITTDASLSVRWRACGVQNITRPI